MRELGQAHGYQIRKDLEGQGDWTHHVEAVRLWAHTAISAIAWTKDLIARLERGEHILADG